MALGQQHVSTHRPEAERRDVDSEAPPSVSAVAFRQAMSCLPTAVYLVTTDGPGGRAGFTASAVCSVTDDPPTLLVCINRRASAYAAFADNALLCVNALGAEHETVSNAFGGKTPMAERFARAEWTTQATGAPVLVDALAHFECRVSQRVAVGTHDVLFCEIEAMSSCDGRERLLYFDRQYHRLPSR
ncbi:flavin reductase [Salinicola acroporae]|uniref:FMN reductase (NADH) RutF n=1 Tax=Salinicola acroporae TaxID=1541440 RepID=A0ABT6I7A1_9GAMM|nr:flavin reductase [Salinicola acroporae]MDH4573373.1 FMN reductase [Salinicola acroporae]